jgi:hypothetical protein
MQTVNITHRDVAETEQPVTHGDEGRAPLRPDGPPPAREQLPLPRRQRQAHIEPHLRAPGEGEAGTPFAAFSADEADETTRPGQERAAKPDGPAKQDGPAKPDSPAKPSVERAAAFLSGASRGRTTRPRPAGPRRGEH